MVIMEEFIISFLKENNYNYIKIDNNNLLTNIYTLYRSDLPNPLDHPIANYYYGVYYAIQQNYDLMKIYYLKAIEDNNTLAMCNLAKYYRSIGLDKNEMEKYGDHTVAISHKIQFRKYEMFFRNK